MVFIDNFPTNYNHLMLQELVHKFPGVIDMRFNLEDSTAWVRFDTSEQAKVAFAGKIEINLEYRT